jgi:hypothetical protein
MSFLKRFFGNNRANANARYYAVLGHSGLDYTPTIQKVPDNIVLVFVNECGRYFSRNNEFGPVFKNMDEIKKYASNISKYKNVHKGGNMYPNSEVELERSNSLLHGVYTLPTNILNVSNRNKRSILPLQNQKLSEIVKKISDILYYRGKNEVGVVFGVFCRDVGPVFEVPNVRGANMKMTAKTKEVKVPYHKINKTLRSLEYRKRLRKARNEADATFINAADKRKQLLLSRPKAGGIVKIPTRKEIKKKSIGSKLMSLFSPRR